MSSAQGLMIISIVGDGSGIRVVKFKLFPTLGHASLSFTSASLLQAARPSQPSLDGCGSPTTGPASPCCLILICSPWGKSPAWIRTDLRLVLYWLKSTGSFCPCTPLRQSPSRRGSGAGSPSAQGRALTLDIGHPGASSSPAPRTRPLPCCPLPPAPARAIAS